MKNHRLSHRAQTGFTLIELLVVISIIAILASLAVPGVNLALNKAKQMKDVANAKQVGTILFTAANDNNGNYPYTDASGADAGTSSVKVFEGLVADGYLNNASVLATNGCTVYKGDMGSISGKLGGTAPRYVGWDYYSKLTTSDNGTLPLLVTHGAFGNITDMQGTGAVAIDAAENLWKEEGVAILFVGQNAEFLKARKNGGTVSVGKTNEPVVSSTLTLPSTAVWATAD